MASHGGKRLPESWPRFFHSEAAEGIALLAAAVVALTWANSPWSGSYTSLWHTDLTIGLGRFSLTEDFQHWVNDALMAIFFFVAGLQIKHELVQGKLRDPQAAALPALAALGGMVVPALLYLLVAGGTVGANGWGIPMATDIAFAVGVMALLGSRVPAGLKLFMLTLAIVDDLGAIIVIAVFYADDLRLAYLGLAVGILGCIALLRRAGLHTPVPYVLLGVGVWLAMLESGVHATIAGVALALLVPARSTERLHRAIEPWTSFLILPVFALANAGVMLESGSFDAPGTVAVAAGVMLGLVVGKLIGISVASWLAVRSGLGRLPDGATWPMMIATASIGGIGFTVSLFVAELAFEAGPLSDAAKIGVLTASTLAAVVGGLSLARLVRARG